MKAILFDMDGVLVDVANSYRLAIQKVIQEFSTQTVSPAEIQNYKNRGGLNNDWDLTEAILKDLGYLIKKDEIINRFQKVYLGDNFDGLINNENWLLDKTILGEIKENHAVGIVTGRPRPEALYTLKRFHVFPFFDVIVTTDDLSANEGKPHPRGILMALEKVRCREGFYLGDTVDDMKAAVNAGITPVGVFNGQGEFSRQQALLKKYGAVWVLTIVNQIKEVIG